MVGERKGEVKRRGWLLRVVRVSCCVWRCECVREHTMTLELIVMGVVVDGKGAMQTTTLMMYHHDVCLFVCVGGVGKEKPVANQGNVANSPCQAEGRRTCNQQTHQQSSSAC
jgi:hypothetical protein